jgi:hypothetical protein
MNLSASSWNSSAVFSPAFVLRFPKLLSTAAANAAMGDGCRHLRRHREWLFKAFAAPLTLPSSADVSVDQTMICQG